jgi:hypothetical protein
MLKEDGKAQKDTDRSPDQDSQSGPWHEYSVKLSSRLSKFIFPEDHHLQMALGPKSTDVLPQALDCPQRVGLTLRSNPRNFHHRS